MEIWRLQVQQLLHTSYMWKKTETDKEIFKFESCGGGGLFALVFITTLSISIAKDSWGPWSVLEVTPAEITVHAAKGS